MMISSGKPNAVIVKIFQNSEKTYRSSGRRDRLRITQSGDGVRLEADSAPELARSPS